MTNYFWISRLTIAASIATGLYAEDAGARYGTRQPYTCASKKAPVKGAISPEQAKSYFLCDNENISNSPKYPGITLLQNVTVEVGKGVPFLQSAYLGQIPDADTGAVLYPIRGSFKSYFCSPVNTGNAGKNCMVRDQPNAMGVCYKTTFGDWRCDLLDAGQNQFQHDQPPPK